MSYDVNRKQITTSDIGGVPYANVIIPQNSGSGKPCIIFFSTIVGYRPSAGIDDWTARPRGYAKGYRSNGTGNSGVPWNNAPGGLQGPPWTGGEVCRNPVAAGSSRPLHPGHPHGHGQGNPVIGLGCTCPYGRNPAGFGAHLRYFAIPWLHQHAPEQGRGFCGTDHPDHSPARHLPGSQ